MALLLPKICCVQAASLAARLDTASLTTGVNSCQPKPVRVHRPGAAGIAATHRVQNPSAYYLSQ